MISFYHYRGMNTCYADWAATSPTDSLVLQASEETAREYPANPSSSHTLGRSASRRLKELRSSIASMTGCSDKHIVFTSGGSESNSLVLTSLYWKKRPGSVVIPGIEHPSVREYIPFLERLGFTIVPLSAPSGLIDPEALADAVTDTTDLVCLNAIHNVSGAVQDLTALVEAVRRRERRRVHIHVDAVQALGKIPVALKRLDIDSASFSAHKFSGPRGVGFLYTRKPLHPLGSGGGQESGQRGGTENLPGIAGMVRAMELHHGNWDTFLQQMEAFRKLFFSMVKDAPVMMMQDSNRMDRYAPHIMLVSVSPIPSEVALRMLQDRGCYLSAGSACSSRTARKREHVLTSMGFSSKIASGALRISFGYTTTEAEVRYLAETLLEVTTQLQSVLPHRT